MDTILNLGLNDEAVETLSKKTSNPRFAWDSYRRFIQMFSNVVLGIDSSIFEIALSDKKQEKKVSLDTELQEQDFKELVNQYKKIILEEFNKAFPSDPYEQLWLAISAVFNSWNNHRAISYRNMHKFSHEWGTAVNIQSMVFGNMNDNSATGVCFTRDPSSGKKIFFGEYLVNAQGEDVVAGIRTPAPLNHESKNDTNQEIKTLEETFPKAYHELVDIYKKLEGHYKDMQDIEFTIESGRLYLLQTRSGKRTIKAALKIALLI